MAAPASSQYYTTLDESVLQTLWRDVKRILQKIFHVLIPRVWSHKSKGVEALRDWDLWGPFVICLLLATRLYLTAAQDQGAIVFAAAFIIPWLGAAVVTVNSVLLGGTMSFFQSICLLGYCVFPLTIAAFLLLIPGLKSIPEAPLASTMVARSVIVAICFVWSTLSSVGFFAGMVPPNRKALATYPVFLFYLVLAWMILQS